MTSGGALAAVTAAEVPYLLILGTELQPESAAWLAKAAPRMVIEVWAGSGHFPTSRTPQGSPSDWRPWGKGDCPGLPASGSAVRRPPFAYVERSPARTSATACQSIRTRSTRSGDSVTTASHNSPANAVR